jgi:hypothetical protein
MPELLSYSSAMPGRYAGLMAPEKERKAVREEFEVAYYTKELGRPLQRKMLQQRLNEFAGGSAGVAAAHHGDQPSAQDSAQPPREDRAG